MRLHEPSPHPFIPPPSLPLKQTPVVMAISPRIFTHFIKTALAANHRNKINNSSQVKKKNRFEFSGVSQNLRTDFNADGLREG